MTKIRNGKHMDRARRILSFAVVGAMGTALVGCSTMEKSVALGVFSGLATGAGVGLAAHARTRGTLITAGVGAAVGGLASYLIHGEMEKRDDRTRRDTLFNLENHGIRNSSGSKANLSDVGNLLTSPEVEEDWVDTHTDGKRLIEGHRVWSITDQSRWDLSRKPTRKQLK